MTVKIHISFKQYVKLIYSLTYRRAVMILIVSVAVILITWILGYYLHFLPVPKPVYYQYMTIALITIVQPIVIYFTIKTNYYSNSHLKEMRTLELTKDEIKMTGDSFYSESGWGQIYKIVEIKKWILIYLNSLSVIFIPKTAITAEQKEELKAIVGNYPEMNVKWLKK